MKIRFFIISLMLLAGSISQAITPEEFDEVQKAIGVETAGFDEVTFELRLSYFYGGKFCPSERAEMVKVYQKTIDRLKPLVTKLVEFKSEIEAYGGEDWDKLYGQNNLWRRIESGVGSAKVRELGIRLWRALAQMPVDRGEVDLLRVESKELYRQTQHPDAQLTAAYAAFKLGDFDPNYFTLAANELQHLKIKSARTFENVLETEILSLQISGDKDGIAGLLSEMDNTSRQDMVTQVLKIAFLACRAGDSSALEELLEQKPALQKMVADIILRHIECNLAESGFDITAFEAELACAASFENIDAHKKTIEKLATNPQTRTAVVLYAAAAVTGTSAEAVGLLLEAVEVNIKQASKFAPACEEMLFKAAVIAAELGQKGEIDFTLLTKAMDAYRQGAGGKVQQELLLWYAVQLQNEGQKEKSKGILRELAESNSVVGFEAKINLTIMELAKSNEASEEILDSLLTLATDKNVRIPISLKAKAADFYCRAVLTNDLNGRNQSVVGLCALFEDSDGFASALFMGMVHFRGDKITEALALVGKAKPQDALWMSLCTEIVTAAEPDLEYYIEKNPAVISDYTEAAGELYKISEDALIGLYLAEGLAMGAESEAELDSAELLSLKAFEAYQGTIMAVKCKAIIQEKRGDYLSASKEWGRLAKNYQGNNNQKNALYFQARYHQFYCLSKIEKTGLANLNHAVTVLLNSNDDITPFWRAKFLGIKNATSETN